MKAVTLYESTDGVKWKDPLEAIKRDELDAEIRALERALPPIPSESGRRIKLDEEIVSATKEKVIEICRRLWPTERVFQNPARIIHPMSFAGRFLSEQETPVYRIWHWFMCERDGYLYQQPFFALNPEKFEEAK